MKNGPRCEVPHTIPPDTRYRPAASTSPSGGRRRQSRIAAALGAFSNFARRRSSRLNFRSRACVHCGVPGGVTRTVLGGYAHRNCVRRHS